MVNKCNIILLMVKKLPLTANYIVDGKATAI